MIRDLNHRTAGDIMRTEVLTVSETTPLSEVEQLLGEYRISGAPVTDLAGHIIGVVSMRDLLERYVSEYVRLASAGETILVTDRDVVVAELIPPRDGRADAVQDAQLAERVPLGSRIRT